jgi:ribosome biogenesis GTPase
MACGGDFNASRLDRFLVAAKRAAPRVVVVLTKSDLAAEGEIELLRSTLSARASQGVEVIVLCAPEGQGLEALRAAFTSASSSSHSDENFESVPTVALLGASGVGKSTLTNALLAEERMQTQTVGDVKDRGRHTTTHRELFRCPGGFLLLDSPGIRELQLESSASQGDGGNEDDDALAAVFEDVLALGRLCRWSDCGHSGEEGCAVRAALLSGDLAPQRLAGFEKMRRELAFHARKTDARAASEEKQKWKARSMEIRRTQKVR